MYLIRDWYLEYKKNLWYNSVKPNLKMSKRLLWVVVNTMKVLGTFQEHKVVGCCLSTPKCHTLLLNHMSILPPNHIGAKSRIWNFILQLKKLKKSTGKLSTMDSCLKNPLLGEKNFGIWLAKTPTMVPTICTESTST